VCSCLVTGTANIVKFTQMSWQCHWKKYAKNFDLTFPTQERNIFCNCLCSLCLRWKVSYCRNEFAAVFVTNNCSPEFCSCRRKWESSFGRREHIVRFVCMIFQNFISQTLTICMLLSTFPLLHCYSLCHLMLIII